jgi:O-antigen/teichoic acid export membrane protein
LLVGSNILLVYVYRKGIAGILVTNMWIAGVVGLGFLAVLLNWTGIRVSRRVIKDLVKFGAPYVPTAMFMFLLSSSDRYFLSAMASLGAVGVYALAYKIGMFGTSLVMEPFGNVWAPFLFENYRKKEGPELIGKVFTMYTLVIVGVGLCIAVLSPLVIPLISDPEYHEAYRLIPWVCLAAVFYGMACIADAGILISKKTIYKPLVFGVAGTVAVVLNLLLIPRWGPAGAAFTLCVSFFTLFVLVYAVSSRFYYFKLEYRKLVSVFASAGLVYWLSCGLLDVYGDKQFGGACSVLTLVLFPGMVWYGGVFSSSERTSIRHFLAERAAKLKWVNRAEQAGM